jgi:hypothetical protein
MNRSRTTIDGWTFERVSGAYIDITPPGTSTPVEVINCWNYAEGRADIPDTADALRTAAREWLDELDPHDTANYIEAARYHDIATISRARETAPQYWDAGHGTETPDETATRLLASPHELNRLLGQILADGLAAIDRLDDDEIDAITTTAEALDAITQDTADRLDRYYEMPDEDTAV